MTYKEKVIEIINKNITGYTKSKFTRNDEPFDVLADIGTIIKEIEALEEPDYEVGDEVYMITKTHERVTMQGKFKGVKVEIIPDFVNIVVDPKRVFKTKEAAEQALKELRKIEFKEGD